MQSHKSQYKPDSEGTQCYVDEPALPQSATYVAKNMAVNACMALDKAQCSKAAVRQTTQIIPWQCCFACLRWN